MVEPQTFERRPGGTLTGSMVHAGESRLQGDVVETVEVVDEVETRPLADDSDVRSAQTHRRGVVELGDVMTEQADPTGAGPNLRGERGNERRLAGATRPPDHDSFPWLDAQAQTTQRGDVVGAAAVQDEGVLDVDDGVVRRIRRARSRTYRASDLLRARDAPTVAPAIALTARIDQQREARATATANQGTSRRSGGFGRPDVADTATSRVAICSSHRPPIKPRGRAMHTAAIDFTGDHRRRDVDPRTRSSASMRSSGRSSLAAAAAPNHTAHAPENDRDRSRTR